MALNNIAMRALDEIRMATGRDAVREHEEAILAAVDKAMHEAMELCCKNHAEIVDEHLSHATGVAQQINEESDRRRGLMISNLSAMR